MSRRAFTNLPLPPGTRLPRYRVDRRLSAGGFGVVYLAHRDDGQAVALKEFLPSVLPCRVSPGATAIHLNDPAEARRFRDGLEVFFREADTLTRLRDARVIPVWDVFEANGTAYFVMPFEKGCTLQAAIRQGSSPLSDDALRQIFLEAALGVEALHRHNLYHLDLKPSNLWLRPDGTVVVLDLGASRWQDEEGRASQIARTPGFAAPEQHGGRRVDLLGPPTDVYGLSATLYAALEGMPPVPAPQRDPRAPGLARTRMGQRDARILEIVDRGMQLRPEDRWPQIAGWRSCLERSRRLSKMVVAGRSRPSSALPLGAVWPPSSSG